MQELRTNEYRPSTEEMQKIRQELEGIAIHRNRHPAIARPAAKPLQEYAGGSRGHIRLFRPFPQHRPPLLGQAVLLQAAGRFVRDGAFDECVSQKRTDLFIQFPGDRSMSDPCSNFGLTEWLLHQC